jgi:hypothetical protein
LHFTGAARSRGSVQKTNGPLGFDSPSLPKLTTGIFSRVAAADIARKEPEGNRGYVASAPGQRHERAFAVAYAWAWPAEPGG